MQTKRKSYPADLWLTYRGVRYRPAALQLFVQNGGWGKSQPDVTWHGQPPN